MTEQSQTEKKLVSTGSWYVTFMVMGIPVIGWIYLMVLALSKKQPLKREFARAYLLYQISLFVICIVIIAVAAWIAMPYVDRLLEYMEML